MQPRTLNVDVPSDLHQAERGTLMVMLRARLATEADADQGWDLSDAGERQAHLAVAMSVDPEAAQLGTARRRASSIASILGTVASLLALHDLSLLVRLGT
jgi:hypothetical protein